MGLIACGSDRRPSRKGASEAMKHGEINLAAFLETEVTQVSGRTNDDRCA